MKLRSESSNNFIGDKGKFMAHNLNRMEQFEPQKIADNRENTDVQNLFSNESNKPRGFSAIAVAVALLSLAAVVGVRMRRRMQPAVALADSSGHGIDMSAVFFVSAAAARNANVGASAAADAPEPTTQDD